MAGQNLWFFLRDQFLFGFRAAACPRFYAALVLGFSAWLLPQPDAAPSILLLALTALAEEVVFRLLLQGEIHRLIRRIIPLPGLSLANIATSAIFIAAHLLHHPPLWALSVFFPSLVFGWAWIVVTAFCPRCFCTSVTISSIFIAFEGRIKRARLTVRLSGVFSKRECSELRFSELMDISSQ